MTSRSYLEIHWPTPPDDWALASADIHVWAAPLDVAGERLVSYARKISADERERAGRFHSEQNRNHFVAGRGLLRVILGRYLAGAPADLTFAYGVHGKPVLDAPLAGRQLHFNLAHSGGLALVAVTRRCPLGIDMEQIHALDDADAIAERFFSAREMSALRELPAARKREAFFNLWTRKEAWLKATGEGIGSSLREVEVSLLPEEPARLISLFGDARRAAEWTLHELKPADDFKAALAVPALEVEIHCWRWPDAAAG